MGHVRESLVVRVRVNGRHHSLFDAERLVEDLCDRSEAVRRAGGVRDEPVLRAEGIVVDAHDDHRVDLVLRGDGQHDAPSAGGEVLLELVPRRQHPRRLDDDLHPEVLPRDSRGVPFFRHRDAASPDRHRMLVGRDVLVEDPHHRVVFEEIGEVGVVVEVVDRDDLDVVPARKNPEDGASDSPEAVDPDPDRHAAPFSSRANRSRRSTAR